MHPELGVNQRLHSGVVTVSERSNPADPVTTEPFRLVDSELLAAWRSERTPSRPFVLLEAHFTSLDHPLEPDEPGRFHIPGAIQVHPSYLEAGTKREKYYPFYDCPADGNVLPREQLHEALARLGITPDSHVVVYGREPDGTMAAARLAWGLLYAGVGAVSVLDGGIDAWMEYGGPTTPNIGTVWDPPADLARDSSTTSRWQLRTEILATTTDVRMISSGTCNSERLVDVRRRGEWDGSLTDYYCFYSQAGHIPGAIHQGNWDSLLDPNTHKLRPRLQAVAHRWRELGIVDAKVEAGETALVFYCGTGWRSSIGFLVATLLGYRARNYDEGFYGWSWRDRNRVEAGMRFCTSPR